MALAWSHHDQSTAQTALLRACRLAGGRSVLAKRIGASVSQISNWINRGDSIPYHYALLIVEATTGIITLDQLCANKQHVNQLVKQNYQSTQPVPLKLIHCPSVNNLAQFTTLQQKEFGAKLLTQPILLDTDYQLLAFAACLQAHQQAGSKTVPAIIIDINKHLRTNTPIEAVVRMCPPSERIGVGEIIRERIGQRRGRPAKIKSNQKNFSNFKGRTLDLIIRLVGLGNRITYSQAKTVLTYGSHNLRLAMDKKQLSISLAATIAKLPHDQQNELLKKNKRLIRKNLQLINKQKLSQSPSLARQAEQQSASNVFITQQRLVDIVEIHQWLLQQSIIVTIQKKNNTYTLTLKHK